MKRLTVFAILMGMAAVAAYAATALDALRVAQAEMSGANLVEISGTRGAPEPSEWTFAFADPTARGGVTELTVRRGAVASRRTPLRDTADIATRPALFIPTVKVDSEKAFDIANRAAVSRRMVFHSVDYVLSSNGTMPIWALTLRDADGFSVGLVHISAINGMLVGTTGSSADGTEVLGRRESAREGFRRRGVFGQTARFIENTTDRVVGTGERVVEEVPRGAGAVADSVKNRAEAVGRTIGRFFIGEEGMANVGEQGSTGTDAQQPSSSPQRERTNTNVVEE